MDQRVQLITLGVPDLDVARRFYVEGLGWQPTLDIPGEITFLQVGPGLLLGLFGTAELDADIGRATPAPRVPQAFTLAQVVATEDEVVAALDAATAAGGVVLKAAQRAAFGGFHGYFADPSGFCWEVATNPGWSVSADGIVTLVPV